MMNSSARWSVPLLLFAVASPFRVDADEVVIVTPYSEQRAPMPIEVGPTSMILRIRPQSPHRLAESHIADMDDAALWKAGAKTPQEHQYHIVNAYSSQEYVHIDGKVTRSGPGSASGGGNIPPFHVTIPAVDLDWIVTGEPQDEAAEETMALWVTDQTNQTFVVHCPQESRDDMFQWQNGDKLPDMTLLWTSDLEVYSDKARSLVPLQSPYRIPRSEWTSYNKTLSFKVSRNKDVPYQDGIRTIRLEREHTKGDENANTAFDEIKYRHAPRVFLKEVSFSGEGNNTLLSDLESKPYEAPHWKDASIPLDGDADDKDDLKHPICFTSGTKMSISAKWVVPDMPENWSCTIKGNGPNGFIFPETPATINGPELSIDGVECVKEFPRAVDFFNPMRIEWTISAAGMTGGFPAGRSENLAYVTLERPLTEELFHTVVRVGCESAKGKTVPSDIFNAIWEKFKTRNIVRADTPDASPMGYYRDISAEREIFSVKDLLKNNDGRCQAWSSFLIACMKAQGNALCIEREVIAYQNWTNPRFLIVKNVEIVSPSLAIDHPGIPGQGTANPEIKGFGNHFLVEFKGLLYDPSYGIGPFQNLLYWQTASIAGYQVIATKRYLEEPHNGKGHIQFR